jgi:hypothetical protein
MAAAGKKMRPEPAAQPALMPDALIATTRAGRIRLIEKRPPRRRRTPPVR